MIGFILQPTYRVRGGVPVVQLYGRLAEGGGFLVEDDRARPFFYVRASDAGLLDGEDDLTLAESGLHDLTHQPLVRVTVPLPSAVPPLRERIERLGGTALEADIRFAYRYLIDRELRGGVEIEGEADEVRPGFLRFRNPDVRPAAWRPDLGVLSIDLETTPDASEIFSIALVGCEADEVHLVSRRAVEGAECHRDERALLSAAARRVRELDPDLLTGWNVVDFDLRTWVVRCDALGLPCHLGRTDEAPYFQQDAGFTRQSRAVVPGRMILDGIPLVRDAVKLLDYRLETVAQAVLGRGKKIDQEAPDAAAEIQRLYREEPEALVAYNREDAKLVLEILDHEGLVELAVERSLLSGMQLDRVGASIASFDLLYLPELARRGFAAPSVDRERKSELVRGGALLDPQPGVFRNIAVFDFKSLYPSLMRTFSLDPLAHALATPGDVTAPNGARFAREGAILPEVIERFMARREEAKRRGDRHADQSIKIMMNSLFGVLGSASCRFFDPSVANAITGLGQQMLHWTRDAYEGCGVRVIYGDTDSVFVQLSHPEPGAAAAREAEALRDRVQVELSERIRREYAVKPRLELELEYVYDRFFLPRVRGGGGGSKKRYAGWRDGALEIVGLEAVRRDWPAIAGRLQRGLLERMFRDEDVVPFARELVDAVVRGAYDEELVYVKRIRKGSLDRYTASSPPHVQAARKIQGRVGPVVRYVVTKSGPEPVLPGRPLPRDIDHRHYRDRVLAPVADAILPHLDLDIDFDEILGKPKQLSLL